MKKRYGAPLYRVPVDFQQGCPHRKKDGSGGCTFCPERGGRSMQTLRQEGVDDQIQEAIRFVKDRYGAQHLMAYFQAFTANFLPESCNMYRNILNRYDFRAVSIGTRPDSLTDPAYEFLKELNQKWDVWIELGAQTSHDRTLSRINRGHDWNSTKEAVLRLHEHGINSAAHIILGLPGETKEDFRKTAEVFSDLPLQAVKIHNLHILKDTHLGTEYLQNPFLAYSEHEYSEILIDFLRHLRPDLPVIRISTDSLPEEIIEPRWTMTKNQFRSFVIEQMNLRQIRQGDLYQKKDSEFQDLNQASSQNDSMHQPVNTDDGSVTFYSKRYKEHYHTTVGAKLEAVNKYFLPGKLPSRLKTGPVEILDVCFGLGYNSLVSFSQALAQKSSLNITALEMDRNVVQAASETITDDTDQDTWRKILNSLYQTSAFESENQKCGIEILWGDARHTIESVSGKFDLIFLDPFSPPRNPELWTLEFFQKLRKLIKPDGLLLTYCAAIPVRSGLLKAGFFVGETEPIGRPRGGTAASPDRNQILLPLPESDLILMESQRGIPYRDPAGVWTGKEILRDREISIEEFKKNIA